MKAKAFANNDIVTLVWNYDKAIEGCLGFCIKRKNINSGKTEILKSMVGFSKKEIQERHFEETTVWPIQKFNWNDYHAKNGETYEYEIVPMVGEKDNLEEAGVALRVKTNQIGLSPGTGNIKAYFNRGILSTQSISSQIPKGGSGAPNYKILAKRICQPGDSLRERLTDELKDALINLLDKVIKEGGKCYCALYELSDPELIEKLIEAGNKVNLVLSNTGPDDHTNEVSRATLHESNVNITDRFVAKGHIGHNKFIVYVDSDGNPDTVLTGSTNWTVTGLCAQSNNAILIKSEELASHYLDYWKRLKDDEAEQGAEFRKENNSVCSVKVDGAEISLWFSPNTKQKNKTAKSGCPKDMQEVFDVMEGAKKSILFLAFQPGTPSIIQKIEEIQLENEDLFIRGAATDLKAVDDTNIHLFHRGVRSPVIVGAKALQDDFSYWMTELLKSSPRAHAIIHDKVVVVDAFTDNCAVITGSHNLGYRASYNNDENLLIIKGDKELATSYATHILNVYGHYRFRYYTSKLKSKSKRYSGLKSDDSWQEPYFNEKRGESIDTRFWF
jgi:phosphatidylserine/phosphatidylglycerophosphate/cardiolipin synthase-like enzyme